MKALILAELAPPCELMALPDGAEGWPALGEPAREFSSHITAALDADARLVAHEPELLDGLRNLAQQFAAARSLLARLEGGQA